MSNLPKKAQAPMVEQFALPSALDIPDISSIELPEIPNIEDILNPPVSIIQGRIEYGDSAEQNCELVDEVVNEQFAAIHAGRKQQAQAIELANDTEYWFAMYFQSREQKEVFLQAMNWFSHGDKYIDGQFAAKIMGIELPPRPAPYKAGRLDKKLMELT